MSGEPRKTYDFGTELDDLGSENWTPNEPNNDTEPSAELDQVRKIAEDQGFTSREPKPAPKKEPEGQFTIRTKQSVIDEFRTFAKDQEPSWPLGYTLERALKALKRELAG